MDGTEIWNKIERGALVIDVRTPEEYANGHLPEAINIPHTQIQTGIARLGIDADREVVVYCRSGHRSSLAREVLLASGFCRVFNGGGYEQLNASRPKRP